MDALGRISAWISEYLKHPLPLAFYFLILLSSEALEKGCSIVFWRNPLANESEVVCNLLTNL